MKRILLSVLTLSIASLAATGCYYERRYYRPHHYETRRQGPPPVPEVVVIPTQNRRMRYIVDTRRRLCFFQVYAYRRVTMSPVDCNRVPEARRLLANMHRRGPQQPPVRQHNPNMQPPPRIAPVPRTPTPPPVLRPNLTPAPKPLPPSKMNLTEQDKQLVKKLYPEIVCLSRQGKLTEDMLKSRLKAANLTLEKYRKALDALSANKEAWTKLTKESISKCKR